MFTLGLITDLFFISLLAFLVWKAPKSKTDILCLLFAEFCVFAGLNLVIEPAIWYDPLFALVNTAFIIGFMLLRAHWLAFISAFIVIYHITLFVGECFGLDFSAYNYPIMVFLSTLQIIAGLMPEAYDGIRSGLHRMVSFISRDSHDHHCVR